MARTAIVRVISSEEYARTIILHASLFLLFFKVVFAENCVHDAKMADFDDRN